jgi:ribonuclease P protein component
MIARQHRFHGLGSLKFVYSKGGSVRSRDCTLKYILNTRRKSYRAAVVVSRKVNKSAVVRNRIRRRIYEALRDNEPHIQEPYDIVISVFSESIADIPVSDVNKIVKTLLTQADILDKSMNANIQPATNSQPQK